MPAALNGDVQSLLSRKARAMCETARSQGKVDPVQLEELERLARLHEIDQRASPRLPRKRWPIAIALAGTLIVASILLFARVPKTEIELDLTVSGIGFELTEPQVLAGLLRVSAAGASRFRLVRLPAPLSMEPELHQAPKESYSAIRVAASAGGQSEGTVTLDPLALDGGAGLYLETTGVPSQYRLLLHSTDAYLNIGIEGPVLISVAGTGSERVEPATPRSIRLRIKQDDADLTFTIAGKAPVTFASQLDIRRLSLIRIDEFSSLDRTVARHVSTILSGDLYFESLKGRKRTVRPGEILRFDHSEGTVRVLGLASDEINLRFHGTVRGLRTGIGNAERSLMPTYLEWLRAQHGLSLLWGSTLYLFGLAVGAMKWWRGSE